MTATNDRVWLTVDFRGSRSWIWADGFEYSYEQLPAYLEADPDEVTIVPQRSVE